MPFLIIVLKMDFHNKITDKFMFEVDVKCDEEEERSNGGATTLFG